VFLSFATSSNQLSHCFNLSFSKRYSADNILHLGGTTNSARILLSLRSGSIRLGHLVKLMLKIYEATVLASATIWVPVFLVAALLAGIRG
jgi:hypothetical protein